MASGSNSDVLRCSSCGLSALQTSFSLSDSFHENLILCDQCTESLYSADADQRPSVSSGIDLLLDDIKHECNNPRRKYVDVILLLGMFGTGKSSLINTIHKALTGKYKILAKVDDDNSQTVTTDISWYEHCGVDPYDIIDPARRRLMISMFEKLPHIVDLAGFFEKKNHKTLIELLIRGCVNPGTNSKLLMNMNDCLLKLMFSKPNPKWQVTKICIVQSVRQSPPENLIENVKSILNKRDSMLCKIYNVDVYLILSKWDLVTYALPDTNLFGTTTSKQPIPLADAKKVEKAMFEKCRDMIKAPEHCRKWASYSNDTSGHNPRIDRNALEFIKTVLPVTERPPPPPPLDCVTLFLVKLLGIVQFLYRLLKYVPVFAIIVVILAVIFYPLWKGLDNNTYGARRYRYH